jgi:hypothetical protein
MKTYWEFITMKYLVGRFVCAECGYDSMSKTRDRNTIRYDCVFCGWDCFMDWLGEWWNQETSHQVAEREFEEDRRYQSYLETLHYQEK